MSLFPSQFSQFLHFCRAFNLVPSRTSCIYLIKLWIDNYNQTRLTVNPPYCVCILSRKSLPTTLLLIWQTSRTISFSIRGSYSPAFALSPFHPSSSSVVLCVKCLLMPAFIVIGVSKCCTPDHLCYIQYYTWLLWMVKFLSWGHPILLIFCLIRERLVLDVY